MKLYRSLSLLTVFILTLAPSLSAGATPTRLAAQTAMQEETLTAPALQQTDTTANAGVDPAQFRATSEKSGAVNQRSKIGAPDGVLGEVDPNSTEPFLYIVQLSDAPLATYQGEIPGLSATSPRTTGHAKLDPTSAASANYRAYLTDKRATFLRNTETTLERLPEVIYQYDTVFHGVTIKATPQEAAKLLGVAGVESVQRVQWRYKSTDVSHTFIGVDGIWNGEATGGLPGTKGEGIVVGVIDTGIWPEHPSFADDGTFPRPPAGWGGVCAAPRDRSAPYTCNNKLIGVQFFLQGYAAIGGYDGLFYSGRDDDGHGTHTASTAAGNENVQATIFGVQRGKISGMAPRAQVSAYKGLGPQGGTTADLVAAIEKAVKDGVDVINYSVGGAAGDPWTSADDVAFLAAFEAGVFVATSAGNAGPGVSTIGSPANAPWVLSVGASYANRVFMSEIALQASSGATLTVYGTSLGLGVTNMRLVDALGVADATGNTDGTCLARFKPGTFQPTDIVLCKSGRGRSSNFANSGGAAGAIFSSSTIPYDYALGLPPFASVQVLNPTIRQIRQFMGDHPGETIQVTISPGAPVLSPDERVPADTVVGFSSRGPALNGVNKRVISVIKPDVTAPGIQTLAGYSPENTGTIVFGDFDLPGQLFAVIQGTSMSSPHVAGVGALLKALHPDWTPGQIRSALMSTALTSGVTANDPDPANADDALRNPADPFDIGAGRVDLSAAGRAGFVLDVANGAFAAANPAKGGDPATLNLASLSQANCIQLCTWVRTIRSTQAAAITWTLSASTATSLTLTVEPQEFVLEAGASQVISVTADVTQLAAQVWSYGTVSFSPSDSALPAAHFPVAVQSSLGQLPLEVNIETRRNAGTYTISGLRTVGISDVEVRVFGGASQEITATLVKDPTRSDPYDLAQGGVYSKFVEMPAIARSFLVRILASTAADLDLFVGRDLNGDGLPSKAEELCTSTSLSFNEFCELGPDEVSAGVYWLLIQNWSGSPLPEDTFTFATTVVTPDVVGQIQATAPSSVQPGVPFDIQLVWHLPTLKKDDQLIEYLELGDRSTGQIIGSVRVRLKRLGDDVVKKATASADPLKPGDIITYTVTIEPETNGAGETVLYALTDTLPAGVSLLPETAVPAPQVNGNQLVWGLPVGVGRRYVMTTSANNPACRIGAGNYIDLEALNIKTHPAISGTTFSLRFDDFYRSVAPINLFGSNHAEGLYVAADGFLSTQRDHGATPGVNSDLPAASLPNGLLAPFWRDFEVVYDAASNRGVTLAGIQDRLVLIEFDDVEPAPAGSSTDRFDFEVQVLRQPNDAPGNYEVIFAYAAITGTTTPGTVGIENDAGTQALKYAFNDAQLTPGLNICFEWTKPGATIQYAVRVNNDITLPAQLTNQLEHSVDLPGSRSQVVSSTVSLPDVVLQAAMSAPASIAPDGQITYTLTVSNSSSGVARNVVAQTQLPPGTEHVSGGTLISGVLTLALGDVAGGSSAISNFVVQPRILLPPPAAGEITAAGIDQPAIIGGKEAKAGDWPWQVAILRAQQSNNFLAQFCGGVLIDRYWVVTAAHCVIDPAGKTLAPSAIQAGVGMHDLGTGEGKRMTVSQIVVHPQNNVAAGLLAASNDIALLRLAQAVEISGSVGISGSVQTIGLVQPTQTELFAPDRFSIVTGWGTRSTVTASFPRTLYQVTVPLVSGETCAAAYSALGYPGLINGTMLCAGYTEGGKDSCAGDSGGPLMVKDGAGSWRMVGIVSSGAGCARPDAYGIYSRAPIFVDWIYGDGANTFVNAAVLVVDEGLHRATVAHGVTSTVIRGSAGGAGGSGGEEVEAGVKVFLPVVGKE